jgi:hypothetical protein
MLGPAFRKVTLNQTDEFDSICRIMIQATKKQDPEVLFLIIGWRAT